MSTRTLIPRRKASLVAIALAAVLVPSTAQARHGTPAEDGTQPPTRIITVKPAATFDWTDAGIGAGGTIGVLAVAAGTGLLLQRQRNQARPA
jgi:hypothetical protein